MVKGNRILQKLGRKKFIDWLRTHSGKFRIDLNSANLCAADLYATDLRDADLFAANLRGADLRMADLRGANIDFSCWPLWCGSANAKIDEKQAKQLAAHVFNVILDFWPGGITEEQKSWLNTFHRIESGEFPKFE